jgi:hypothetical protein
MREVFAFLFTVAKWVIIGTVGAWCVICIVAVLWSAIKAVIETAEDAAERARRRP